MINSPLRALSPKGRILWCSNSSSQTTGAWMRDASGKEKDRSWRLAYIPTNVIPITSNLFYTRYIALMFLQLSFLKQIVHSAHSIDTGKKNYERNPHIKVGWFSHYLCSYIFELLQYTEHMAHASTILVMEGIRAGWNKALRTILLLEWKEAPEQNCAVCWALTAELEFSGGRKGPPFAAEQLLCS